MDLSDAASLVSLLNRDAASRSMSEYRRTELPGDRQLLSLIHI